ncbi:MAG: two-component regulator propeller domain-containing protein [Rikenellaceae bacterium]
MIKRNISKLLLLLALIIFANIADQLSAKEVVFNRLTFADGLSQETINSIYQDPKGYIWIATRNGLNRFDGTSVKVFRKEKHNSNSLLSNNVRDIVNGDNGILYLMFNDGVSKFDTRTQTFETIFNDSPLAIDYNEDVYIAYRNSIAIFENIKTGVKPIFNFEDEQISIKAILRDRSGRMWIGTRANGIYTIERDGELIHRVQSSEVTNIFEDDNGDIWVGTWVDGAYHYIKEQDKLMNYRKEIYTEIPSNFVRDFASDNQGNVWIGTSDGLCKYTPQSGIFQSFQLQKQNSSVWSIIKDHQGNIWFGTYYGGVSWFNPEYSTLKRYEVFRPNSNTPIDIITGRMTEDSKGRLWICTEGQGLYVYDRERNSYEYIFDNMKDIGIVPSIKSIYYDSEREIIWIGTHLRGLFRYDILSKSFKTYTHDPANPYSIPSNIIRDIAPYKGELMLATFDGVVAFDPDTGRSRKVYEDSAQSRLIAIVSNIHVDHNDLMWMSVEGRGLFVYNFKTNSLINYTHESTDPRSLSSNNVSTIVEDYRGNLWFGHECAGVDRFNAKDYDFDNFDTSSGLLIDDRVYEICDNLDGSLYISTGHGFTIFNVDKMESYKHSSDRQLLLSSPNENAMYRTSDGEIFLGGINGLFSFKSDDLLGLTPMPYKLRFNSLYVNQREVSPNDHTGILSQTLPFTDEIVLDQSSINSFSITFTSSNFIPELEDEVEFMLEGYDTEWLLANSDQITYTNLMPGSYRLKLRSTSEQANVGGTELSIKIKAPFYNTSIAWVIYILIALGVIAYLLQMYRARIELHAQVEHEQSRIKAISEENRTKLRFFTNISHEFRTPLAIIIGQIELLLNTKDLSHEVRNRVTNIHTSSIELNSLIKELLDFRKQEQGHLHLKVSSANVISMLDELCSLYGNYIESKDVKFIFKRTTDKIELNCDVVQLRKVVTNLLSNAIKHTDEGGAITVTAYEDYANVVIGVADTGSGIAEKDINHIFDRFYQGNNSNGVQRGTGIGLAFAKGIVDLHNGTIEVNSQLGQGSLFTVKIPKELACTETKNGIDESFVELTNSLLLKDHKATQTQTDNNKQPHRPTILIVEDDISLLNMLEEIFAEQYNVVTAHDGREGIEKAQEVMPTIIVSDVMMPHVSGIELCRTLRKDVVTSHIPIVLLTARTSVEHTIEGLKYGADDYVAKPFNIDILRARCSNLINNRIILQEKFRDLPEENTYKMATNATDQKFLEQAMEVIEDHMDDAEFNIAQFSSQMALSRTNLFNKIKAVTGQTPNDFIMTVRLKRAATILLNNPEMSIISISESIGFNSYRYFGKRFKEKFGLTPNAYRTSALTAEVDKHKNNDKEESASI